MHVPRRMVWLRSRRFDLSMQLAALLGIAPALLLYSICKGTASAWLPLASLVAIPFVHVFGSFFVAFSAERNRSPSPPARLWIQWALWAAAALALSLAAPRMLATFALVYGGWHILRQNFGFLRELAHRAGLSRDLALRKLDLAACLAPAVALWLLVASRGPWRFIDADVYHPHVPRALLAAAFAAVPGTILLRELCIVGRRASSPAALLLLAGNGAALLGPALLLSDLTLVYTLSASFHGVQYLAYVAERERERRPSDHPTGVLVPLGSAIVLSMLAGSLALAAIAWLLSPARAEQALLLGWYVIVPFHYFVDGRIWRRPTAMPIGTATV